MPGITHFEIHAGDPERAVRFYRNVFGWNITRWEGGEYWLVTTGPDDEPGINGGIIRRRDRVDGTAVIGYVCSIDVDAIDRYLQAVQDEGGEIVEPRNAVPGLGWLAYAKDTEGNIFALFQNDAAAG